MKIWDGNKLIADGKASAHFWHRLPKAKEHVTIGFGYSGKAEVQPPEAQRFRIEMPLHEFKAMMHRIIDSMR